MSGMAWESCELFQKTTNYVDFSTTNWNDGSCRRDAKSVFQQTGRQSGKPILSQPFLSFPRFRYAEIRNSYELPFL